jgi:simple sugar transport system permease protein/ribose transport system permease protein
MSPVSTAGAGRIGGWWRFGSLSVTNRQLVALLVVLVLGFSVPLGGELFSGASLRSIAFQMPEMGILALAMMVTLLSGGVDLSIIAIANLAALTMAYMISATPADLGTVAEVAWDVAAVVAGFTVALVVGIVNGAFIAWGRVSPILATLGTMSLVKGLAIGLTHGDVISGFPPAIVFVGNGTLFGIPVPLFVLVLAAFAVNLILTRTPFGVRIAMMGTNSEAVRFSGIDTARVTMGIYAMSGLLAGLAGFIMLARFNSANAAYGESYLLVTILAAVLGGVDPAGGFGRVSGVILALIILQVISTAFNLLDLSQFLALAIWGATLIAVAGLKQMTVWVGRRRRSGRTIGGS